MARTKKTARKRSSSFQQQQDRLDSIFDPNEKNKSKKGRPKAKTKQAKARSKAQAEKAKESKKTMNKATDKNTKGKKNSKKNDANKKSDGKDKRKPPPKRKEKRSRDDSVAAQNRPKKRRRCNFSFPSKFPLSIAWVAKEKSKAYNLDMELIQFANYVRLGDAERAVRDTWTSQLNDISPVTVFGSHSVPEICAYCSDLDVIILGNEGETARKRSTPPASPTLESVESTKNAALMKDSIDRKNRWLDALAEVDAANEASNRSSDEDVAVDGSADEEDVTAEGADEGGMFVIDRKGSSPEESKVVDQEDSEIADQEVSKAAGQEDSGVADKNIVVEIDDSDEDTADALVSRISTELSARRDREVSVVSDEPEKHDEPTVSFMATEVAGGPRILTKPQVLQILKNFRNKLIKRWRGVVVRSLIIKNARVPIIKVTNSNGCETDICCSGMQGSDTSLYAAAKVKESACFAPVVLFLKILLNQYDLDVPFNGGLGSFKLYVLVSDHCRRQQETSPGNVLRSFLRRFSNPRLLVKLDGSSSFVGSDGTVADMGNVYRWDDCCALFAASLEILERNNCRLATIIDADRLRIDREAVRARHR